MTIEILCQQFVSGILQTSLLEFIAVILGISSVYYARKENILVYPTGILSTTIYIYLCFVAGLFAEASVNFYYTMMSIIGFMAWRKHNYRLQLTTSTPTQWVVSVIYFSLSWLLLYLILKTFTMSTVAAADAFAAATAYTGMWLMTRKKLENWIWWITTNIACVPLYFIKGYVFTSFQYVVFFVLSVMGYVEWRKKILAPNVVEATPQRPLTRVYNRGQG